MAPLIIGPRIARAYREVIGDLPPGIIVLDPNALDALDIEIRPDTITRMRLAAQCQRTADLIRAGKVKHDG